MIFIRETTLLSVGSVFSAVIKAASFMQNLHHPVLQEFILENVQLFSEKPLTFAFFRAIIAESSTDDASGCGAVGSALPWGGRGRGFKSRHSDQ